MNMSFKWLAVPALLAILAASGRGSPLPVESVEAAANRTLCPYTVEEDVDRNREPELIKVIKCLSPDKKHLSARHHRAHGHAQSCLEVRAASHHAHCVELHDTVRVRLGTRRTTLDVAVGCACMFLEHGSAKDPEAELG